MTRRGRPVERLPVLAADRVLDRDLDRGLERGLERGLVRRRVRRRIRRLLRGLAPALVLALGVAGCADGRGGAAAGPDTPAPGTAGSEAAGPQTATPQNAGPQTATPETAGPQTAGRVDPPPTAGISAGATVVVGPVGPLAVEVADDAAERAVGLMGRVTVPDGTGMVFLYDEPVRSGFWMANVEVPLSIAWALDGTVVGIGEMQPCPQADSTCPLYLPTDPDAVFDVVVEATGGTFTDAGVTVGDPVQLTGVPAS